MIEQPQLTVIVIYARWGEKFRSTLAQEQSIEVRPLTILAGANSSGKSSIMQPLLLLKQTLDATYDPGALLLNGPNVRFTTIEQILSRVTLGQSVKSFHAGAEISTGDGLTTYFTRDKNRKLDVERTVYASRHTDAGSRGETTA